MVLSGTDLHRMGYTTAFTPASFPGLAGIQVKGGQHMVSSAYILLPCPKGGDLDDLIYPSGEGPLVSQR